MPAVQAVGRVCHECHARSMGPGQLRFRWGDFHEVVAVTKTGEEHEWSKLMRELDLAMAGILVDARQGPGREGREHFARFEARFLAMEDGCARCHAGSPRAYFVDERVKGLVRDLGTALDAEQRTWARSRTLSTDRDDELRSLPLVHVPAALARSNEPRVALSVTRRRGRGGRRTSDRAPPRPDPGGRSGAPLEGGSRSERARPAARRPPPPLLRPRVDRAVLLVARRALPAFA